ncbi:cramped [Carabus blaptoides fortunei]
MNYRVHQHHHHHHHDHDETFFLPPKDFKTSSSDANKNNRSEIPLTLIQELNEIDDVFMLTNYLEGDAQFMEEISIKSRFGDVERAAAITPKPAKCMPILKEIELKNSSDPSYFYYPSCTRIERCGGCCSHSLLSCQPAGTEIVTFQVIVSQYTGGTKLTLKGKELIQVEKHTKCNCECVVKQEDCNSFQEYRKNECRCVCLNLDERRKCEKNNTTQLWDPRDCTCKCRETSECSTGLFFDNTKCACVPVPVRRRFAELNSIKVRIIRRMDSGDLIKNTALQSESAVNDASIAGNESVSVIQTQPIEEMLGSVTTYNNVDGSDIFGSSKNCQQLRTSARVFKKMKLDSALAITTAPTPEKEKKDVMTDIKLEVKKPLRPQWSPEDKDIFFEALNEYGKDFDAIQQHINNKFKKKGLPDSLIKTKDQVRHFYYRTWHKVSKHLKFAEDIKKIAQELYALINYGELRKKAGSVSEKTCMKLNELIYRGTVAIRVKGKTIRIKTPMCRALRKLNQLDEKHEDLKLPTRILVELWPKNMETWFNVQFMAQNPRVKFLLPLQRRLSALLICLNERWKTQLTKAHEKVHGLANNTLHDSNSCSAPNNGALCIPQLRFAPKSNCPVEVPTINLSEYLTSHRICLNAYEERIGVKIPGEQLWQNMCASFKGGGKGATRKGGTKRQRNESTGEKSIVKQRENCDEVDSDNPTSVNYLVDINTNAINTILSLQKADATFESVLIKEEAKNDATKVENTDAPFVACNAEEMSKIKNGWTLENCGTLTIGEMYLMFGNDSKLELEYSWDTPDHLKSEPEENSVPASSEINVTDIDEDQKTPNQLSMTLKKLLSVAKLHYRKERVRCPCGHVCGGTPKTTAANRNKSFAAKTNQRTIIEEKNIYARNSAPDNVNRAINIPQLNCMRNVTVKSEPSFRKPAIYPSNGASTDSFRAQLDSLQRMRPKYTNRKGRPVRSKHVVVERMLPLLPKPLLNGHSLVTMKVISQTDELQSRTKLKPIAPRIDPLPDNTFIVEPKNGSEFETTYYLSTELPTMDETEVQPVQDETEHHESTVVEIRSVASPTSISNFLDLDIPQSDTNDLILSNSVTGAKENLTSFAGLLCDEIPDTTPLSSPSRILKENDNQWLNSEVNDYSLTSLLGHLESPMKTTVPAIIPGDDTPISQDIDSQFPSLLGENGVDFVDQFVDMAAQVNPEHSEIEQIANT